ncbi:hypothetical protein MKK65_07645 [Methylobacterium sp. J-001]|uniref:hypothetical protein n=1 Tax=Methylobacterium sp. J-001 TaxID=2836609 RepID=UPI001FBC13D1|nr:hypothetical protein [Methylobacterium sp. J-001]MCJ2116453.1 hypothetical protein [Methylobacterium sp. J-001]
MGGSARPPDLITGWRGRSSISPASRQDDREIEVPEVALPEVAAETSEATVLPWRGRGNFLAAVGVALLEMVGA